MRKTSAREIVAYATLRQHPRIAVAEPVQIETATNPRLRDERILELGAGGMFVETRTPEPVGARIEFCFYTPSHERVAGEADVVYRASLDGRPGVGLKFVALSDDSSASLREFVSTRLQDLSRES